MAVSYEGMYCIELTGQPKSFMSTTITTANHSLSTSLYILNHALVHLCTFLFIIVRWRSILINPRPVQIIKEALWMRLVIIGRRSSKSTFGTYNNILPPRHQRNIARQCTNLWVDYQLFSVRLLLPLPHRASELGGWRTISLLIHTFLRFFGWK